MTYEQQVKFIKDRLPVHYSKISVVVAELFLAAEAWLEETEGLESHIEYMQLKEAIEKLFEVNNVTRKI